MPPIAGNWPSSPDQPLSPYGPLPPFEGDQLLNQAPPEGDENSGSWSRAPYGNPLHPGGGADVWGAMKPDQTKVENPSLPSIGTGGSQGQPQQEIPSQIWIPDREGIVHMSIPPFHQSTSLASLRMPSQDLILVLCTFFLFQ